MQVGRLTYGVALLFHLAIFFFYAPPRASASGFIQSTFRLAQRLGTAL